MPTAADARAHSVIADAPALEGIETAVYVIPTDAPEADGTLAWDETTVVLVTVTAGGERGTRWTYAAAMAISAVDVALWDLKARLLGLPLADLLGRVREQVAAYGSGGFTSYDERQTREQLTGWVERDRIPRVKIKIGESWGRQEARDLARVALARQVIGPDTELYVDANGGYTTGQAVRVAHQMSEYGVTWFEEPVSSQNLAGLAAVRSQVQPDVEYFHDHQRIEKLLFDGALDADGGVLIPDPGRPSLGVELRAADAEHYRRS
jgi:L-alanine-DL-glutamate epimerase-like enolase superfamily enzyme